MLDASTPVTDPDDEVLAVGCQGDGDGRQGGASQVGVVLYGRPADVAMILV